MERVEVATVGAWCGIATVPVLIGGGALLSSSGAGDLIPPTGTAGQEWLLAVASAPRAFAAGGWLLILMGYLVLVALSASTPRSARRDRSWSWRRFWASPQGCF